jgi:hypothetical protein
VVYKLQMMLLNPHSIVLKDMSAMPSSMEVSICQDGESDKQAIHLGLPFTVRKLDHMLRWFVQ